MTDAEMIAECAAKLRYIADGLDQPNAGSASAEVLRMCAQFLVQTQAEAQAARAEAERLREVCDCQHDALARIAQWADAYPRDVFTPLSDCDIKQIRQVVTDAGFSFGALHASWARHLVGGIGGIARTALQEQRDE